MRLQKHLNEYKEKRFEDSTNEFNKLIKKNCKPYLKLIGTNKPLYRGLDTYYSLGTMATRKGRRPGGTASTIFPLFNYWLSREGHNRRDNNIILTTSNKYNAENFSASGSSHYVFPIGNISYTYIKANDVNMMNNDTGWGGRMVLAEFFNNYKATLHKGWEEYANKELKHQGWDKMKPFGSYFVTDKGFKIAYSKGYEIWIKCKEYYFANESLYLWSDKMGGLTKIFGGM